MPRIIGVDIPREKRVDVALTYTVILGINSFQGSKEEFPRFFMEASPSEDPPEKL